MAKKTAAKSAAKPRSRGSQSTEKAGPKAGGKPKAPKGEPAPFDAGEPAEGGKVATKAPPKAGVGGKRSPRSYKSAYVPGSGKDRHLVIVESPSKAKTINKYLGREYLVLASVGHVRDLPSRNPKGVKSPVPGVDLEKRFEPTYVVSEGKERVISDLKRAAKEATSTGHEVWFATDLDREGEAIAWHLAQELGIASSRAKRVVFPAITKAEIEKAFKNPHPINEDRVNAQQARRILDRIVGYQVSPLLWKKVARGLSAGRVQSVAVRVVVEREREIRAFVPDEYWAISAAFTDALAKAPGVAAAFSKFLATPVPGRTMKDGSVGPETRPTQKAQNIWLGENGAFRAELVDVGGEKFELGVAATATNLKSAAEQIAERCAVVAKAVGMRNIRVDVREDPSGKGPARYLRTISGDIDPSTKYAIESIETKRTSSRPPPPFITSTLQQAGANRLGFASQRTMRTAQQLYEGVDIPGEGPVGLITYMRTDSTNISGEALNALRSYIGKRFGDKYLPEKPNFFSSSNKDAQEAHEAIRPTNVELTPQKVARALNPDQLRLYTLIWERAVACQMTPAQWDSTAITIKGGTDAARPCSFRATGRVLVFDGFYKVAGVPQSADEQTLPRVSEKQPLAPVHADAQQKFTSPPPRYTEASLIKILEQEGIGRPSTYASIISVIQERNYVEKLEGRFYATDLGEVVTDKLIEAFPEILDVGYTREMEEQLDKVEDDHLDWVEMLRKFYGPFKKQLALAETELVHAKAEQTPAPPEYTCPTCEKEGRGKSPLVYRFGKNGRFLSCSRFNEGVCKYASPVDREGKPRPAAATVDVACHKCGSAMTKRVGRFGPFLGCSMYADKDKPCDGLLNLDKKGRVEAPSVKPLTTEVPCAICEAALYLRTGVRGPWLSCSRFPKCRGRGKWAELPEAQREALELALAKHEAENPIPIIRTMSGKALTDAKGKPLPDARPVGGEPEESMSLEALADEVGV